MCVCIVHLQSFSCSFSRIFPNPFGRLSDVTRPDWPPRLPVTAAVTLTEEECVSSVASGPSAPPSTFCLVSGALCHGQASPRGLPALLPTSPNCCLRRKCHPALLLLQLGSGCLRRAARTVAFGAGRGAERRSHINRCQMSFSSFLSELKQNKQGEVISPLLPIGGLTPKKVWMTLCEGAIRYAGPLLLVWRRADPTRCRNEVRSCTPGNSGGSDWVGIVFQTGSAGSKPSAPFGGLDAEPLPARSPLRMISACQDWLVSSGSGDARQRADVAFCAISHTPRNRVLFCVAATNPKSAGFRETHWCRNFCQQQ